MPALHNPHFHLEFLRTSFPSWILKDFIKFLKEITCFAVGLGGGENGTASVLP